MYPRQAQEVTTVSRAGVCVPESLTRQVPKGTVWTAQLAWGALSILQEVEAHLGAISLELLGLDPLLAVPVPGPHSGGCHLEVQQGSSGLDKGSQDFFDPHRD